VTQWLTSFNFSYTTSYRLPIVTFALEFTVWPQYHSVQTTDDDGRNGTPLVRSDNKTFKSRWDSR